MATTTDLSVLKINYLTQAQYNTALSNNTINANEIYFTPVSTLGVADGGTGITSNPSMLTNLASTTAANVFQASPRPGVTGILGMANGGTGNAYGLLPNNKSATSVNIGVGTWQPKSSTLSKYVWQQKWTTTDFTYTPSGGSATTITDTADIGIWLSANETSNALTANLNIDGKIYAMGGFEGNLTGNASTATKATQDANGANIASTYLKLSGGTMTGQIQKASVGVAWVNGRDGALIRNTTTAYTNNNYNPIVSVKSINGTWDIGTYTTNNSLYFSYITDANHDASPQNNATTAQVEFRGADNSVRASKVYGAVWNDYAEYRQTKEDIKPGKVVIETGNGDLKLSDRRLQPGANIVTDTFGFAIGETKTHKTPIAVSGRVLAYPYESIDEFRKHIGGPVCSGPDGTVSIMSINEERLYPSRIIGTVSEIPDYEEWGTENIKVDGRIWIRIR